MARRRRTMKARMSKAGATLKRLWGQGVRKVTLFYTREVNGKRVPNYKTIALTAAVVAAAGAGAYAYRRHKKHGHVIRKK
jgi:hypothetical protein